MNVTDLLPIKDFPLPLTPSVLKPVPALLALGAGGVFLIGVLAIFAASLLDPQATADAAGVFVVIFSLPYALLIAGVIILGIYLILGKRKTLRVGLGEDRRVGALVYSAAFSISFTLLPFICLFAGVPVILAPIIPIIMIEVGLFIYRKLSGPRKVSSG